MQFRYESYQVSSRRTWSFKNTYEIQAKLKVRDCKVVMIPELQASKIYMQAWLPLRNLVLKWTAICKIIWQKLCFGLENFWQDMGKIQKIMKYMVMKCYWTEYDSEMIIIDKFMVYSSNQKITDFILLNEDKRWRGT